MFINIPIGLIIFFGLLGFLSIIGIACCVIDTGINAIKYIEYKKYMKEIKETETNTNGGNQYVQF